MAKEKSKRLIAQNKKAYHDYFIEETFQAGISLAGTEVKSLRQGKCSLKESFIRIENMEAFLYSMILVLMNKEMYSTKILCVLENCFCIKAKSEKLLVQYKLLDIQLYL